MYNDSTKVWYKSLTVWFNVLLLLVATVNQLAQIIPINGTFVADVALFGNFLLRFKSDKGLTLSSR